MSDFMPGGYPLQIDFQTGEWKANESYKEIRVLANMLTEAGIPHDFRRSFDGWQVVYPEEGEARVGDAVECFGSYGCQEDKLEIMGLLTEEEKESDGVLGWLTAQEVFERIKQHYEQRGKHDERESI